MPFRHFFDPYPPDSCPTPITTKIDPYVEHHAIYVNLSLRFCDDLFNCFRRCQICRKWPKFAFDTHKGILIGNLIFMKFQPIIMQSNNIAQQTCLIPITYFRNTWSWYFKWETYLIFQSKYVLFRSKTSNFDQNTRYFD